MKSVFTILSLALALTAAANAHAEEARLTLKVDVGTPSGTVQVAVYDSEDAYEHGNPVRVANIDVAHGQSEVVFEGLTSGDYGIKAFHDVNGNGRMDTNPFGLPVEPYAFSNNAVGNMGPAKWDRAQFAVSGQTDHQLTLR
ncbi:DUF2141 domain-containing protein [uncultured Brevundimonas sp.]|uniref:DUF2141 domain-containing protein n=1 Tax=uncultured Brevundimonas sp. TaxID=213418 RepID=UPI0026133755|nr:DUF2141 domain-containing protein [uncultured Brevundimonas sp.]